MKRGDTPSQPWEEDLAGHIFHAMCAERTRSDRLIEDPITRFKHVLEKQGFPLSHLTPLQATVGHTHRPLKWNPSARFIAWSYLHLKGLLVANIQCMFEKNLAIMAEVYWVIVYTTTASLHSWQIESPCTDA